MGGAQGTRSRGWKNPVVFDGKVFLGDDALGAVPEFGFGANSFPPLFDLLGKRPGNRQISRSHVRRSKHRQCRLDETQVPALGIESSALRAGEAC
jgi:hypothetical protein